VFTDVSYVLHCWMQIMIALLIGVGLGITLYTNGYTTEDHQKRVAAIFFLMAIAFLNQ
jgi:hypothetical protein